MMNVIKAGFERLNHFQLGNLILAQASMESASGETVIEREYEIYGKIEDLKALAEGAVKSEKQEQWGIPLAMGEITGNIRVRRTEIIEGDSGDEEGTVLNLEDIDTSDDLDETDDTAAEDDLDIEEEEEDPDNDAKPEEEETDGNTDLPDEEELVEVDEDGVAEEEENVEDTAPTGNVTYTQTIKVKTAEGSEENEMDISEDTFNLFKSMVPNGLIKTRYFYPVKGTDLTLEVDVFEDMNGVQYPVVKIDLEVEEDQSIDEIVLPFKMAEDSIRVIKPGKKSDEDLEYVRTLFKRHYEVSNPLHQTDN